MKNEKENQEDFILKKIRYYQGSISDFETYWNQKISQGEAEESPETKNCKNINADLNKAYKIIPVSKDEDKGVQPVSNQNEESDEKKKSEKSEKSEKEDKKDDSEKDEKKDKKGEK